MRIVKKCEIDMFVQLVTTLDKLHKQITVGEHFAIVATICYLSTKYDLIVLASII